MREGIGFLDSLTNIDLALLILIVIGLGVRQEGVILL